MNYKELLNYEIFTIGEYSLLAYQPILVLIIIIATLFLQKSIKYVLEKNAKSEYDLGRRHSIFLIAKYVIWVLVFSICLEVLGFKVTLLLAGSAALLVGLGFGVQQLFNDFVSGILLLLEGTIQVNDIIEVDGIAARVEEINLRASKVVTRHDVTIIIPNHKFISENVINWSHNKGLTRFTVDVGVAYGSDVNLVKELLLKVMNEHEYISKNSKHTPIVRFTNFGDSSLDFEILFYTSNIFRVQNLQSDLRFAINKIFIENDITIPFPQRDLHIYSSKKIDI